MSQTISGSQTAVQTLASAHATIASGASVIANGKLGTYTVNFGSPAPQPIYGAVFAPASLGVVTIHNLGVIDANGSETLGPLDAGIVIGGIGTVFNTGTIAGNSAIAMFGTTGSDFISNTKLIAGSYGVGLYLASSATISNSGTIIGTSGTYVNASAIEIRGTAFVTNSTTGTINSIGADSVEIRSAGTVLNAGLITGYGAGVNLRDTGLLSNASTGTIDGYRIAVGLYGGGTIINAGHIINTGNGQTSNTYAGIELGSYGNNPGSYSAAVITNTGTITGADYGIGAFGTKTTVTNSGLILSEATKFTVPSIYGSLTIYATGIELINGGSVTNQTGGSIIGANGIVISNTGFASNAGYVSGSLVGSAIFLSQGGTVSNTGSLHAQEGAAIYGYFGFLTASNAGSITAAYGISSRYGAFITNNGAIITTEQAIAETILQGPTNTAVDTIINSGILEATATVFAGVGIFAGRDYVGAGIELNGGTITNTSHGTIIAGGDGIIAYYQATNINNAGTVIGTGIYGITLGATGSIINSGLISGYRDGIRDKSSTATIINTGVIIATGATFAVPGATGSSTGFATGTYISHGVQLTHGGDIINQSGGTIKGQTAIDLKGSGETISNAGLVISTGHAGIYLNGFGTVTNTGTIEGATGINLAAGGIVTDAGAIISTKIDAVSFASGFTNRLILDPGAIITGTAKLGGGVLELASSTTTGTLSGLGTQFTNASTITIDTGAHWTITGAATITAGETLTDYGTLTFTGAVTNNGLIITDPAIIIYDTAVTGTGTIDVTTGDTIIFHGSVSSTETIDFLSSGGTIITTDPSQFNATVIGTGTEIFACFAAGTRILTPRGQIPVEQMQIGDILITTDGEDAPVKWIGHRRVDLTKTRHPEKAQPIRIKAGAIADNIPARDLLLSPDHALYFENHLIPAKALLNNRNVTQLAKATITYYHIELANHAAIFAEQVPCETYLETGNRACFENAPVTSLAADFNPEKFQAQREAESFAPFCESGLPVEHLRTKLLNRAFQNPNPARRHA